MFQLFKRRNFNELVGDTFTFFKLYGKHYFKNYCIINGGFILILLVLVFFIFKIFYEGTLSGISNGAAGNQFDAFINDNFNLFIGFGVFAAILAIIISLISYLFPVVYLDLLSQKNDFSTKEIANLIKSKIGKVLLFFLGSVFIIIPLMMILFGIAFALAFILIGIPLLFIMIPAFASWYSLSFYDYITTDNDFFASLSDGFSMMKKKFWPVIGSTIIMYIIIQVIVGTISMIPYIIGMVSMFTTLENPDSISQDSGQLTFFMIMMLLVFVLSVLLNFICQNLLLINQGVIYYSLREEAENNAPKSEIDLIGTQSE